MFNLVCKPDEALASYMASEGIDWKFLPPRAPNFGGLWEAGVKSFKFYLKRVVGNIRLTYEEFLTVIIQIEGMLNSRPLVLLSSDLDDLNVLTPSHFLIGRSITSIVEPDLTNLNENRLDNWQKITKIIQLIWKRWSVDYLNSLQQRNKWHFEKKNAKIGDMVIIKEDNLPSCQWSLGRINNIYPGKDSKRWCNSAPTSGPIRAITLDKANSPAPGFLGDEVRNKKGTHPNFDRRPLPELQKNLQTKDAEIPSEPGVNHVHPPAPSPSQAKFD
ncbi:integrase catalytic domain-containing protein [Trichonephila clavipes]|nr:integrase catalytic domain-containing protein [Trichonephila clavipes]